MKQKNNVGIPISTSLGNLENKVFESKRSFIAKKSLLKISALSILVAVFISLIAKFLIYLINLVTNISFFGLFNGEFHSPADNNLGLWVIVVPIIGGVIVGFMALYGSKAIRGHGIPEAMEQILVNQSKIKPSITILKPLSSAIAIGTGGPFGAEGPIIATGGALGSTLGQLFKINSNERKIILAAGATAGMSAVFGTPIAAIFLAIELLLFEFSPKAILPVALACITGAAGHHLLFESGPVFPMPNLIMPSNLALGIYSSVGIIIGFISIGLTKIVYFIEDTFEKIPIHWVWWPAVGGIAVGVIGYFSPHTLGVGYDNITAMLSGKTTLILMVSLCFFKFLSWSIALGSGTSGGTLAPLLTIGGAAGAILGSLILLAFPNSGINIPMASLIGMSAMFAGASRAYLTSITFALEATMQSNALLPLLGACTGSYLVSFFFMENTIMTEKIARRGIITPDSYEPDVLSKMNAEQIIKKDEFVLNSEDTIQSVLDILKNKHIKQNHFLVKDAEGSFDGILSVQNLITKNLSPQETISTSVKRNLSYINNVDTLKRALEILFLNKQEYAPVVSVSKNEIIGLISQKDILAAYNQHLLEDKKITANLSLTRQRKKVLVRGRQLIAKRK
ncbi:chloride channel protein [Pedobacter sp. LMG 31464]|uniref:Chloride channel protein n=1 Tax=Pedobacter planticolens TaxID=2679964 RepID=A0A923ITS2_9SPHI|nr:chloride channel protein [Pedobacter planticolens]MBB2145095.1 chloride channel protein [Pedobacter planticolens]